MNETSLTPDEQRVLDYVRFAEQRSLRRDVWINPFTHPGANCRTVAMNLRWWLPPKEPGGRMEPDTTISQPILESLVRKGKLVLIGNFVHPITKEQLPHYGTPGFKTKHEALWLERGFNARGP